ncbi:MAG: cupin domain-containing protein [Nitrospira sp.]|nr:cupin domain-containing protein [Nitrospira sp.]
MDVLSDVLKAVKLDGAVFFNGEFSSPWCARQPDACSMASYLSAGSKHVIIYHLMTEGRGYARVGEHGRAISLEAGDIIIIPHGDAHLMGNGPSVKPVDSSEQLRKVLAEGKMLSQFGGGGELTRLVCGYMTCDPQLSQVFLARTTSNRQSPHSGQSVGTMGGRHLTLFRQPCRGLRTWQRCCHRQTIGSLVRGNFASVHREVTANSEQAGSPAYVSRTSARRWRFSQTAVSPLDDCLSGRSSRTLTFSVGGAISALSL